MGEELLYGPAHSTYNGLTLLNKIKNKPNLFAWKVSKIFSLPNWQVWAPYLWSIWIVFSNRKVHTLLTHSKMAFLLLLKAAVTTLAIFFGYQPTKYTDCILTDHCRSSHMTVNSKSHIRLGGSVHQRLLSNILQPNCCR